MDTYKSQSKSPLLVLIYCKRLLNLNRKVQSITLISQEVRESRIRLPLNSKAKKNRSDAGDGIEAVDSQFAGTPFSNSCLIHSSAS